MPEGIFLKSVAKVIALRTDIELVAKRGDTSPRFVTEPWTLRMRRPEIREAGPLMMSGPLASNDADHGTRIKSCVITPAVARSLLVDWLW
jgi:hypothetical protein